jgi:hypothetical protein
VYTLYGHLVKNHQRSDRQTRKAKDETQYRQVGISRPNDLRKNNEFLSGFCLLLISPPLTKNLCILKEKWLGLVFNEWFISE